MSRICISIESDTPDTPATYLLVLCIAVCGVSVEFVTFGAGRLTYLAAGPVQLNPKEMKAN